MPRGYSTVPAENGFPPRKLEEGIVGRDLIEDRPGINQQIAVQLSSPARPNYLARPDVAPVGPLSVIVQSLEVLLHALPLTQIVLAHQTVDLRMLLHVALKHPRTDEKRRAIDGVHQSLRIIDHETAGRDAIAQPFQKMRSGQVSLRAGRHFQAATICR